MTYVANPIMLHILSAASANGDAMRTFPPDLPLHEFESHTDPLLSSTLRLTNALIKPLSTADHAAAAIIFATHYGSLRVDHEFDRSRHEADGRYASPAAFTRTLPGSLPTELSIKLQIKGPLLILSGQSESDSLPLALRRAHAWLNHFHLNHALAGTFDWRPDASLRLKLFLLSRAPFVATTSMELTAATGLV
jgi:hypothetical protein